MAKGGKREGAGRKPKSPAGPAVTIGFRLAPDVVDAIRRTAEQREITNSALVEEGMRAHLGMEPPSA